MNSETGNSTGHCLYRSGYKYQLAEDYSLTVDIHCVAIDTDFAALNSSGRLIIRSGYAWDGPSGPTFDTPTFMRGSLVHDAIYQLIRLGLLPAESRVMADRELWRICREDGMCSIRAWWVYHGVRLFGGASASADGIREIRQAGL